MARYSKSWVHRTSIGKPRVYRGARQTKPLEPDDRLTTTFGQQGVVVCPQCGAAVTLKKAAGGEANVRELGIRLGDLIISPHRVGGGRYTPAGGRKGDTLCLGSRTKPPLDEEESA